MRVSHVSPVSLSTTRDKTVTHIHRHHDRQLQSRSNCICKASASGHAFDLPLAVSLAYTSFEAYLQPTGAEGYEDIALNGTKTTFADGDFLNTVYSGVLLIEVISASNLRPADMTGKSDPYAVVSVNSSSRSTPVLWQNLNPVWGTRMCLYVTDKNKDLLKVRVYDKGIVKGDTDLGYVILPVSSFTGKAANQGGHKASNSLFDSFLGGLTLGRGGEDDGVVEVKLEGPGSGSQGALIKLKASYLPLDQFEADAKAAMTANEASPPPAPPPPSLFNSDVSSGTKIERGDLLSTVERMVKEDERRRRRDRSGQVGGLINAMESLSDGVKGLMNTSIPPAQPSPPTIESAPSTRVSTDSPWRALTVMAGVPQDTLFKPLAFVENEETDSQVWLFSNSAKREAVIAFRGTEQIKWKDLVTDLNLAPCAFSPERLDEDASLPFGLKILKAAMGSDNELKVHSGFLSGYDSMKRPLIALLDQLTYPSDDKGSHPGGKWRVIVTGHSLGGALATLCAFELSSRRGPNRANQEISMYTFGAPRAGNAIFASQFNSLVPDSWRITNNRDIVPSVPRLLGYSHVRHSVRLASDGSVTIEADGSKDIFGEGRGGLDVIQDLIAKSQVTVAEGKGEGNGWESVYSEVAAKEMEIFAALADGSALEQHMETFYLETLRACVLARMKET